MESIDKVFSDLIERNQREYEELHKRVVKIFDEQRQKLYDYLINKGIIPGDSVEYRGVEYKFVNITYRCNAMDFVVNLEHNGVPQYLVGNKDVENFITEVELKK